MGCRTDLKIQAYPKTSFQNRIFNHLQKGNPALTGPGQPAHPWGAVAPPGCPPQPWLLLQSRRVSTFHQVPYRLSGPIPLSFQQPILFTNREATGSLTLHPACDSAWKLPFGPGGCSWLWSPSPQAPLPTISSTERSGLVSLTTMSWSSDPRRDMEVGPCLWDLGECP